MQDIRMGSLSREAERRRRPMARTKNSMQGRQLEGGGEELLGDKGAWRECGSSLEGCERKACPRT